MTRARWDIVLLFAFALFPFIPGIDSVFGIQLGPQFVSIFIFALLALGLNVVVGYAGLLQLGIAAFFAIGAYITGILTVPDYPFSAGIGFWGAVPISILGAAIVGVVLAAPTLRLRGDYLAIVTLGFAEVVRYALINLDQITNGSRALNPVPPPNLGFLHQLPEPGHKALIIAVLIGSMSMLIWRGASQFLCLKSDISANKTTAKDSIVSALKMSAVLVAIGLCVWISESFTHSWTSDLLVGGVFMGCLGASFFLLRRTNPGAELFALAAGIVAIGAGLYFAIKNPAFKILPNWDIDYRWFYYLTLLFLIVTVLLLRNLERSRLGRALMAIREDELAATCMGVNATMVKLIAFAIGAGIAGLAGCLYATRLQTTAGPNSYDFAVSIITLCFLIVGGLGNSYGAILGAFIIRGFDVILSPILDQLAQKVFTDTQSVFLSFSNWRWMIFGLALILMMRFRPEGALPSEATKEEMHSTEP